VRFGEQKTEFDRRRDVGVTTELNFILGSPNPYAMILLKRDFEISTKSDVKIHTTVLATNDFGFFKA